MHALFNSHLVSKSLIVRSLALHYKLCVIVSIAVEVPFLACFFFFKGRRCYAAMSHGCYWVWGLMPKFQCIIAAARDRGKEGLLTTV